MRYLTSLKKWTCALTPPQNCLVCTAPVCGTIALCPGCEAGLPWQPPGCRRCAIMLDPRRDTRFLCADCYVMEPAFDLCHVLFEYCHPVRELIGAFKYRENLAAGQTFGRLLARSFSLHYSADELPGMLVPVPLHRGRLQRRGFNQALELARAIHREHPQAILAPGLCQRVPFSVAQRGLDAAQRRRNVRGVFRLTAPARLPLRVAIIDDVVTTTATVNELALTLCAAGAQEVHVWALARVN